MESRVHSVSSPNVHPHLMLTLATLYQEQIRKPGLFMSNRKGTNNI